MNDEVGKDMPLNIRRIHSAVQGRLGGAGQPTRKIGLVNHMLGLYVRAKGSCQK